MKRDVQLTLLKFLAEACRTDYDDDDDGDDDIDDDGDDDIDDDDDEVEEDEEGNWYLNLLKLAIGNIIRNIEYRAREKLKEPVRCSLKSCTMMSLSEVKLY